MQESLLPIEPAECTTERRAAPRCRTLMSGMISCDALFSAYPCRIRNISDTGAMIIVEQLVAVPARFTLLVELSGFKVDCLTVWQKGTAYGVRFVSSREETKFKKTQVLSTSEKALSERTMRDIEMRGRSEEEKSEPVQVSRRGATPPARPSFGKRV